MIRILFFIVFFQCSIFIQAQISLDSLSNIPFSARMSDVWGFEKSGSEYAIATTKEGVAFIDVTIPTEPELLFYPQGPSTQWRDAKKWGDYVYVCNEVSGGVRIFDLTNFPDTLTHTNWTGGDFEGSFNLLDEGHNLFIDENGILYVIGYNYPVELGGVMMLDITTNPTNPTIVGIYDAGYVHDVFVRGDTMWTAEYNNGYFAAVDISDKLNWSILATEITPNDATHNVWLSDNGQYLFTTDETNGGKLASYDVSDLSDIQLLDVYSPSETTAIPHNTFVVDNYLVTSYYTVGVKVIDFSDPSNLTEVNGYDTSPSYIGQSYNGCWGVYPYLPSGNILATDIQEGFFVLGEPAFTSSLSISVKLAGAMQEDGSMRVELFNQGYLPAIQTYSQAPYNFSTPISTSSFPTNAVDWILVEARSGIPNTNLKGTTTVETQVGVLLSNGQIVGEDGNPLVFKELIEGNDYYFCVRHRNHLDVLSANSITASDMMSYDFTSSVSQAFGAQQQQLFANGEAVLFAGDFNQDGTIQSTDFDAWKLTPAVLGTYAPTDANLDGIIQVTDYDAWFPNKAKIGSVEIGF